MLRDERWPVARLTPITSATGVDARERNAASTLLAVVIEVRGFHVRWTPAATLPSKQAYLSLPLGMH